MFLSAGQTSDYIGARVLLSSIPQAGFPQAGALLADRGYDANWFRNALIEKGIAPCIPSRIGRKVQIPHDADLYRQRHKIENMFARLKDWPSPAGSNRWRTLARHRDPLRQMPDPVPLKGWRCVGQKWRASTTSGRRVSLASSVFYG